jgi:hypothetical protein
MSQSKRTSGYSPAPAEPSRLTFEEFQQFARLFRELIEGSQLKWWIIAAGVGGLAETIHLAWRALRYVFRF